MEQPGSGGKGKPGGGHVRGSADLLLERLVDLERKKGSDGAEGWDVFEFRSSGDAQVTALRCALCRPGLRRRREDTPWEWAIAGLFSVEACLVRLVSLPVRK